MAFVRCVPTLNDDVVQLIAQELVDNVFVLALDFEEVCQCAYRSSPPPSELERKSLRTVSVDRAVLADEAFERVAAARKGSVLGTKLIAGASWLRSLRCALMGNVIAQLRDLGFKALERFGNRLEAHGDLAAFRT